MKKPGLKKNQSIVHVSQKTERKVGELLGKLDSQQMMMLVEGLSNIANSALAYGSEVEKTKQAEINSLVEIEKINAMTQLAKLQHEQKIIHLEQQQQENKQQFKKDMQLMENSSLALEREDQRIHKVLDLFESGHLSEESLNNIIDAVKGKG